MLKNRSAARPWRGTARPWNVQRNADESSRSRRLSQAKRNIDAALSDIDPADRPHMLRWLASLGLVGLAATDSCAAAAEHAYRVGDALAVR